MSATTDRKIRDVRDVWGSNKEDKENPKQPADNKSSPEGQNKHKYKTLERHLSMKKTIRRKMMRDLREIGDASNENANQSGGFLEQIRTDQPPPANIDKPSLWKRLTKGWGHTFPSKYKGNRLPMWHLDKQIALMDSVKSAVPKLILIV